MANPAGMSETSSRGSCAIVSTRRCSSAHLMRPLGCSTVEILRPSLSDGLRMTTFLARLRQSIRAWQACGLSLPLQVFERFEKNYIRRMPQIGGNGAAGTAGDDDFKKFRRGGKILKEFVLRFDGLGLARARCRRIAK